MSRHTDSQEYLDWEGTIFYPKKYRYGGTKDKIMKEDYKLSDLLIACDNVSPFYNRVSCDEVRKLYESIITARGNGDDYQEDKNKLRILYSRTFSFIDS